MCGRYSFAIEDELILERFGVKVRSAIYKARYNCAPSQNLAVISTDAPDVLNFYRWGLIPSWARDPAIGNRLINARGETILEKPSFRNAFKTRRCLVLSDGFYEWRKNGEKRPYRVTLKDNTPFAMAGIWDKWKDPTGEMICSFSIITTQPNSLMEKIHDRMPVILEKEDEKKWITATPERELIELLRPFPSEKMKAYPISRKVNSPANDSPDLIVPTEMY
jgi:putative SOS response-associated peptidase YedK